MITIKRFFLFCFFVTGVSSIEQRCEDENKYCKLWTSMKLCENPQYLIFMKKRCRKSCNLCFNKQTTCSNYDSFCDFYSSKGYCKALHIEYMRLSCCMSCKFTELKQMAISGDCGTSDLLNNFLSKNTATTREISLSNFIVPWAAYILTDETNNCIGFLISKTHVVTTAHCIYKFTKTRERSVYVQFGNRQKLDNHQEVVKIKIKKIIIHPSYNKTVGNIAILALETTVNFSSNIRPICLPTSDESGKKKILFARWSNREGDFYISKCSEDSKSNSSSPFRLKCANLKNRRHCQNESLTMEFQQRYYLIGLFNWNYDCNETNGSLEYIRIFDYIKWIVQNLGE